MSESNTDTDTETETETETEIDTAAREQLQTVDGIGPASAEQLLAEFGSLRELSLTAKMSTTRIARLDGFSPSSANTLFDRMNDAGVLVFAPEDFDTLSSYGITPEDVTYTEVTADDE